MMDEVTWQPLQDELKRWTNANRIARFWLRDDDAVEPTAALERLMALCDTYQVPLTLAVIPAHVNEQLARRLAQEAGVNVAVHGWSHENHASANEKKQELGPHRAPAVMSAELVDGYRRLEKLFPNRFVPVLVPPWNRIDPVLLKELPNLDFGALSVFGPPNEKVMSVLPVVNTHVDLMDWHGTRGCKDHGQLVEAIVTELRLRCASSDEPIGILTHHLVHDESAWDFLQKLFALIAAAPAGRWISPWELL
ncbi:polysaccharide deacetylase family protein [Phyllobacterium bourgognense]|uniref:Chitooligosaccharide deacetylase n=1 Tax=Phyllobacterium bourgognense TaxID=314236 RepID=A0A368YTM7_9HYPH|nr:polysaccharide deacetylase family protein [Phyllobacterium bourgognense]RCW82307.1 polysaccharide deacetylase [Phyllobacterium bourgognense]